MYHLIFLAFDFEWIYFTTTEDFTYAFLLKWWVIGSLTDFQLSLQPIYFRKNNNFGFGWKLPMEKWPKGMIDLWLMTWIDLEWPSDSWWWVVHSLEHLTFQPFIKIFIFLEQVTPTKVFQAVFQHKTNLDRNCQLPEFNLRSNISGNCLSIC